MKRMIAAGMLVLCLGAEAHAIDQEIVEKCGWLSKTAGKIMAIRQSGGSLEHFLRLVSERRGELTDAEETLLEKLAIAAWQRPQFRTKEYQEKAIEEFKNDTFEECYRRLSKGGN